jgi:3-oxoacyl-[acyl-carrier protein] reductase
VALTDIEDEFLAQSVAGLRGAGFEVHGEHLDVTSDADWEKAVSSVVAQWGGLGLLVNCAGISPRGTVESTDEALWDRTLAINLKGAWLGIKTALPYLRQARGTIVNIGSTRATRPMPGLFSYVVSKAGLWGLTQQVAVEYLADGIRCNMIAPGWVDTPNERMIQARFGRPDFPAGIRNLTTPEEIGASVVHLASIHGRKINGVILYLDAGLSIADDAGMVYLPDRTRPPFEQRIDGP